MLPRPSGAEFHNDANEIEKYMQTRGIPAKEKKASTQDERAALHKAIVAKHPSLAPKAKTAGIGDVLSAGKNLATSALKSGGMGQVAKSFGNVAGGLAKAHPLATAGIAAGGGLLAGRMMSRPQPKVASLSLRGVAEGARQLPLE
jgi:hypothetical protein